MEAAFCRAERETIVGSVTPAETRSSYSPTQGVEANVAALGADLVHHDGAVGPSVAGDLADRLLQRPVDDPGTRPLVTVEGVEQVGHRLLGVQEHDATARHDALLEGRAGRTRARPPRGASSP